MNAVPEPTLHELLEIAMDRRVAVGNPRGMRHWQPVLSRYRSALSPRACRSCVDVLLDGISGAARRCACRACPFGKL